MNFYQYNKQDKALILVVPDSARGYDPRVKQWEKDDGILKVYVRYNNEEAGLVPYSIPNLSDINIHSVRLIRRENFPVVV